MEKPKTVLLVEDHALVTDVLEVVLQRRGYVVLKARRGDTAAELLEANDIPLLITDIELPGKSGLELIEQLRSRSRSAKIVAMSGRGHQQLSQALVKGADATLKKPFTAEALTSVLSKL